MAFKENEFKNLCQKYDSIYIYGAGWHAKRLYPILQQLGINISGFYVSKMEGNPESLFGLSVEPVSKYDTNKNSLIIMSIPRAGSKIHIEIFDLLVEKKIDNIYFITNDIFYLPSLKEQEENKTKWKANDLRWKKEIGEMRNQVREICNSGIYQTVENAPVESVHALFGMKNDDNGLCYWRVRYEELIKSGLKNISEAFTARTALEEFENQFGPYHIYDTLPDLSNEDVSCSIFMATSHLNHYFKPPYNKFSWLIPIQVGAALGEEKVCDLRDNYGPDHISDRNSIYSEATAIYWMWKNVPRTDYVGLCHYRRHFDVKENLPLILAGNSIDVLTTVPTFVHDSIGQFFSTLVPGSDLNVMLDAIRALNPEYYETAQQFLESRFFPPCNLFVMRYDIFQEYASFLFSTTFAIEKFYSDRMFYRSDRYMGFLVECLMGIYLMKNRDKLKIAYTDMVFY